MIMIKMITVIASEKNPRPKMKWKDRFFDKCSRGTKYRRLRKLRDLVKEIVSRDGSSGEPSTNEHRHSSTDASPDNSESEGRVDDFIFYLSNY